MNNKKLKLNRVPIPLVKGKYVILHYILEGITQYIPESVKHVKKDKRYKNSLI